MNEQTLFLRALDQPPGEARQRWLEKECHDHDQRVRIAKLLNRHEGAGSFLERPPAELLVQSGAYDASRGTVDSATPEPMQDSQLDSRGSKPEKSITKTKFVDRLIRSRLMTVDEVAECDVSFSSVQDAEDARTYAQALVEADVLTSFQAKAIYEARIKGLTFGEYIILDQLGKGGMGIVYRAKHRRMDRLVAIKVLPRFAMATKGLVDRFYREVKTAGKLMHPNIVAALDASEDDGLHYLVMEYVDGQDLGKVLRQSGPLEPDYAVDCIIQAARGLQYAHEQGVIHRDIKPANLLIDGNGVVKILDMGLARMAGSVGERLEDNPVMDSSADGIKGDPSQEQDTSVNPAWEQDTAKVNDETRLTKAGEVMGTLDYMSPEQFSDSRKVDERGDIYSLGCTLYRLLTNKRPFSAETVGGAFEAHCRAPIPSIREFRSDVPEQLEAVFRRMLAKDPCQRQSSMAEVISELEESLPHLRSSQPRTRQHQQGNTAAPLSAISSGGSARPVLSRGPQSRAFVRSRRRRAIPVSWIAIGSLAFSLLIICALALTQFSDREERAIASHNSDHSQSTGVAEHRTSERATNKNAVEKGSVSELRAESASGDASSALSTPLPERAAENSSVSGESELHRGPPGSDVSDKGPAETAMNAETTSSVMESEKEAAKLGGKTKVDESGGDAGKTNSTPAQEIAQQWNGSSFFWSGALPQGGTVPSTNRYVEFMDGGKRVSITQSSTGITVSVGGRTVEAASPAALKEKDLKAYRLYEKTLGATDGQPAFSASVSEMQRDQLKNLLEQNSANPQMKQVLENLLRVQGK